MSAAVHVSDTAEPAIPSAEAAAWAAEVLRRTPTTNDRPDIATLMEQVMEPTAAAPLRMTIPGEKAPRDVAVEARLPAGLLLRTTSGWRTVVSWVDLYASHARVLAPRTLREHLGALRTLISGSNRPH